MTTDARALIERVRQRNASLKFGDPRYSCVVGSDELLALLTGYSAALDEVDALRKTQERLVARISATDAPENIDATLASIEGARAQIVNLRTELGEAKLVIEQQDRDLERIKRERDEALGDGVLSQRVCDIENDRAQLRQDLEKLRTGLATIGADLLSLKAQNDGASPATCERIMKKVNALLQSEETCTDTTTK